MTCLEMDIISSTSVVIRWKWCIAYGYGIFWMNWWEIMIEFLITFCLKFVVRWCWGKASTVMVAAGVEIVFVFFWGFCFEWM